MAKSPSSSCDSDKDTGILVFFLFFLRSKHLEGFFVVVGPGVCVSDLDVKDTVALAFQTVASGISTGSICWSLHVSVSGIVASTLLRLLLWLLRGGIPSSGGLLS